jgi:tRNA modification GTPase
MYVEDTIAAVATAPGRGGIGIVRVSGPDVTSIAAAVTGRLPEPRYATYSRFKDANGDTIDEGIALYFKGPDSFTGEDVLELQGHGGPVVLDMLLNRILELGVRIAEPGEFSQRAFLNDKIDLAQAEAIADLIDSGTQLAARGAMRSLQGEFSRRISALLASVIELRIYVEAAIDFPEEEIDFLSDERIESQLREVKSALKLILDEAHAGALLSEGAAVVLVGKPNAGKSSLMNAMTGRDTSIVTHIPGTTRDIVHETLQLDGIPLRMIDTAGIRESTDVVESEGVRRAVKAVQEADLVIALIDASLAPADRQADLAELDDLLSGEAIVVFNKIDLLEAGEALPAGGIAVSVKTGEGMPSLKTALKRQLGVETELEGGFTARTRHLNALSAALAAVEAGEAALVELAAGELLAEELSQCQKALSRITGEFTADDLLGEIFSSFCIGK